ncbi:hypothetical protein [Clostridium tertium]|uniref:Calcium-transporting ATPase 1 n=1 Tax=Clostridium tertium TaxID=1559 RepID=A0A6N3FJF9_9CLOT
MKAYYNNTWINAVENLGSDVHKGLDEVECNIRREKEGNKLSLPYKKGLLNLILELLKQRYLYVFILVIGFFLFYKFYSMAIITTCLVLSILIMKIYHDVFKEKEIEILQNLNTTQVLVLREGVEKLIEAESLVRGDIVYFRKNSIIAADIRIIDSEGVKVDERGVTGDNFIKEKYSVKLEDEVSSIGEISNMLFRGSVIKDGQGKGVVVEVGNNTQLGKLVKIINNINVKKDLTVKRLQNKILNIALCLILVQANLMLIFPGKFSDKMILLAQGVFSIVSILIPFIIIYYGKAIRKKTYEEDNIELNNFSVLELSNKVKIFFLEKVGNLSKNELYVDKLYTNEQIYSSNKIDTGDINLRRLIDISIICNNAKCNNDNNWTKGTMHEIAYARYGMDNSIHKGSLDVANRRKFELPRSSSKDIITTVNKTKRGYRANSRGNLESILNCCTHILTNGIERELTSEDIIKIKLADLNFSKEGLVTEGFAYRSFNYQPSQFENIESNLVFVGIIALENPLFEDAPDDINDVLNAGILPVIFTEDNKFQAEVFGRKIGLISNEDQITSGIELESVSDEELINIVSKARIYCRISPELKNKIISLYNSDGYNFVAEGKTLGDLSLVSLAKVGIAKENFSMLLRKIADIHTEESSIKAFFNLRKRYREVEGGINRGIVFYTLIVLSEILMLNFQYLFTSGKLEAEYYLALINFIIATPVILINALYGKDGHSNKKLILRGLMFIIIPSFAIYFLKESYSLVVLFLLGGMSIIDTIINSKIFSKNNMNALKLLLISILVYALSIVAVIFIYKVTFTPIILIISAWLLFIFLLGGLIIRKW